MNAPTRYVETRITMAILPGDLESALPESAEILPATGLAGLTGLAALEPVLSGLRS